MVLELGAVLGVVVTFAGAVWLGASILRWARRNRADAAELALSLHLQTGSLRPGHSSAEGPLELFRDWLGEKFDDLNTPSHHGGGFDSHHSDFTQHDGGVSGHVGADNSVDGGS